MLFNRFINDLAQELGQHPHINSFYFADDLACVVKKKQHLKICITIIENWSKINRMSLKKEKCGIMRWASKHKHLKKGDK